MVFSRTIRIGVLLLCVLISPVWSRSAEPSLDEFVAQVEKSLEAKDLTAYLAACSPAIRQGESAGILSHFTDLGMDNLLVHLASKPKPDENEPKIIFQVLFSNSYMAIIEMWRLGLARVDGRWQIREKNVSSSITNLYRIQIPSSRAERVESIDIEHVDVRLQFRDALVFYDNIPDLETALLVLGKGRLSFSPSDRIEKQQLSLLYKADKIEDRLDYVFVRCSNSFFEKNIKMVRKTSPASLAISADERARAAQIFGRDYPRSFTIENSMTGELFSFLPQGDEAVFELKTGKTGALTYIYYPFATEEVNLYDRTKNRIINIYSPQGGDRKKRMFVSLSQKLDVLRYQIDLNFQPSQSFLSAKAKIEVVSRVGELNFLKLKFAPELSILRIFDQDGHELFYTQDRYRKLLYVYFIDPLLENKPQTIEVFYRGEMVPPVPNVDVLADPQYSATHIFVPPRLDTYLFSQSALWYPEPPEDEFFQARMKIMIPPDYGCISNGELLEQGRLNGIKNVAEIDKVGNSYYVFETKSPVKYLSFLVGKFLKSQEGKASVPIQLIFSTDARTQRRGLLDEAKSVLEFYEKCFGPYAFEKLSIVQRVWTTSGGHSPASFIILNELPWRGEKGGYVNADSPVDLSRWREYYLAHEIAHQWWGQGVTWDSYHDQWISEGLAQFSSALYLRNKYPGRAYPGILKKFSQSTRKKSRWGPITLGSRLSFTNYEAYQAIIYNKTSLVMEMLDELLGEETFFDGLRAFFRSYKYRSASTQNFVRTMETVSGKELSGFFEGWFYRSELPEVRVTHSVEKKAGQFVLTVNVKQLKDTFIFPLVLEWRENGQSISRSVVVDAKTLQFEFKLKDKPESLEVNPDNAVPGKFY